MKLSKRILSHPTIKKFLSFIAYLYINMIYYSGRWQLIIPDDYVDYDFKNTSAIYAFWHGRLLMMPKTAPKNISMNVLISGHRDGAFIADVISFFNYNTIFGSSSKGSTQALRSILRKIKLGENVAITPDGPRGPTREINGEIINIAKMTKTPIIPMSFSATKAKVFKSWDKFMFPHLFTSGILIYGKPIFVPSNASPEEVIAKEMELKSELNNITDQADKLCNQPILT